MILEQLYLQCLAQASYLIGDPSSGRAVVVDPRRDVDEYLRLADSRGLKIEAVFLTHFHADFVPGHLELRARCGATIHMGSLARTEFEVVGHDDGERYSLGQVELEIRHTPGHTPESICIVVFEGGEPRAILTGDTLFIGDVGRPDLLGSTGITAEELAGQMYDSLQNRILTLPDDVVVYPGHGAGSACGKSLSSDTFARLGDQRATNYALQAKDRAQFVEWIAGPRPAPPRYFSHDAAMNRRERELLPRLLQDSLVPLTAEEFLRAAQSGQVVDTRDPEEFARRHLAGSLNIGLGGMFASWAGSLLDLSVPVLLICDHDKHTEAVLRLGRVGFQSIGGYLEGGLAAFEARPDLLASGSRVDPSELQQQRGEDPPTLVLDVRGSGERDASHIPGSVHIPLPELEDRWEELPSRGPLTVHCATGYRSSIAASLLRRLGREASDLRGGIEAFAAAYPSAVQAGACAG